PPTIYTLALHDALPISIVSTAVIFGASATAHADDAVKKAKLLIYSTAPSLGDAPYWIVPQGMGFFEEEGLEVEPVYAKGSGLAIDRKSTRLNSSHVKIS